MKFYFVALVVPLLAACGVTDGPEPPSMPKEVASPPVVKHHITLDERLKDWATGSVAVKAVVFDCAEGHTGLGMATHRRIVEDGAEHPFIVKDASVFLTTAQVATLAGLVAGTHEPSPGAGCYVPHHGFIFYGEDDSIVAYIEVCLMCARGGGFPRQGLAEIWDYEGLADFIRSIGLPVFEKATEWPPYFAKHQPLHELNAPSKADGSSE